MSLQGYGQVLKPTRLFTRLNVAGPIIRKLRSDKDWSQVKLAEKCQLAGWDISRDTIANIEGQRRWVADHELIILAEVFGVEIRHLLPESKANGRIS